MYKQHKVVLLPTNKKGVIDITLGNDGILNLNHPHQTTYQALYIVSDDKINEGDGMLSHSNTVCKAANSTLVNAVSVEGTRCRKIIATTDNTIYPKCDGYCATDECVCTYPQPTTEFVQHFISEYNKGNVITDVEVEYLNLDPNDGGLILGVNQDNTINIKVLDAAPKVYTEADVKYFMDVAVQWGRNESNYQKDHYQFIRETLNKPAAGELINN